MSKKKPLSPTMLARQKRRSEQAVEGAQAMRDYIKTTEAARERLSQLRAERQAREAQTAGKGA